MNLLSILILVLLLAARSSDASAEKSKKKRRERARTLDVRSSADSPSSNAVVRAGGSMDVTGTAKVKAVPDIALISLTAESTDASSAKGAYSANNILVRKVVKALETSGIEAKDVQTSDLTLAPVYSYDGNKRKMDGWRAAQELVVRVRDISKTSAVLDSALGSSPSSSSSSLLTVNQVSLSVFDPKKYKTEARQAAVKDAQDKAAALAALLGVRVGRPTSIRESEMESEGAGHGGHRSYKMASALAADSSATIIPGERELSHSVFITFETI